MLAEQRDRRGMGMLFITHDLNLAASICDRIDVMSGGRVEERGDARRVLRNPQAEYTQRLVAATPTIALRVEARRRRVSRPGCRDGSGADDARPDPRPQRRAPAASAAPEPMLVVTQLSKTYHPRGGPRWPRSWTRRSRSRAAARSAWWGSRDRASRRSRA